jgi:hypothetical protein
MVAKDMLKKGTEANASRNAVGSIARVTIMVATVKGWVLMRVPKALAPTQRLLNGTTECATSRAQSFQTHTHYALGRTNASLQMVV